ncbi:MAG TPA: HEAT repeat domain-containing protein [Steroidobacteraceae bacterium]|jgi:HEAT repeat protein
MNSAHRSIHVAALCLAPFALAAPAFPAQLDLPSEGWASWEVAAVDGAPDWCCWSSDRKVRNAPGAACRLDGEPSGYGSRDDETTDAVRIYARVAGGKIDRLRVLSASCPVEAATPIRDLGTVAEDDSARWLIDLAKQSDSAAVKRHGVGEHVLTALAINRGNVARDALAGMARSDARKETRKQAVFWLALLRGSEGAEITSSIMFNDKDPDVRQHAAFSMTQSKSPRAAAELIRLGNTDTAGEVRAQAWFWLAHTGATEAENAIAAALRKDADEEVRDRALFALSQLPDDRSTRALIAAAEDRSLSRELRKKAVFWLAQSDSDSARAYLDQVLTTRF